MNIQLEILDDELAVEINSILEYQWAEIGDGFALDIDWRKYFDMHQLGVLRLFTVRQDKKLIAYMSFIVSYHAHHSAILVAIQDSIFCSPEHRGGHTSDQLIDFSENTLHDEGIDHIVMAVKQKRDYSAMLIGRGYKLLETTYLKVLGE